MNARLILQRFVPMPAYRIAHFYYHHRYIPNIISPKTLSEKLCRRMIFDKDRRLTLFADKLAVRSFVRDRLGGDAHLNKLYATYNNPSILNSIDLPKKFVLKPNHGSGWLYLHNGTVKPDLERLQSLSINWLGCNYYDRSKEWCYKDIVPTILVEEFLGNSDQPPEDYKFFCFDGVVKMIQVDVDRYTDHKRNLYNREFELLDVSYTYPNFDISTFARPHTLDLMINISEKISFGSKFMRVDLFSVGGLVRFGEITNYPGGASERFLPKYWDRTFGDMWL